MLQIRRLLSLLIVSFAGEAIGQDFTTFLNQHCVRCHRDDDAEADFRLDAIVEPDDVSFDQWELIADKIESGEMPPADEIQPSHASKQKILNWIGDAFSKIAQPVSATRRLNRVEYEHTLHDLLEIDGPLAPLLPEDGQVQGFDNVAGGLGISSILMERYLEAANDAFEQTIRRIKPLPEETRRAVLMEAKENKSSVKGKKGGVIESKGAFVDFTPGWPPARIDAAHPIEEGVYRCRIAVWPHHPGEQGQGEKRTLTVGVFTGPLFGPGKRNFNGVFDVTGSAENPRIIEWTTRMGEGHAIHILPWIFPEHVTWRDKHEERPGVAIAWAETHGPFDQSFPSNSQRKLFGDVETLSMKEGPSVYIRHRRGVRSHSVDSSAPKSDIRRIIHDFVPRAFRRPVDDQLTQQFVQLAIARFEQGSSFEEAVRAGVTAILCSPHFLLLGDEPKVDDYTIASRLSYFLWSSMPDETLIDLAADGKLSDPRIRFEQVERMIDDPKFERFINHFTDQWLDLQEIEFTTPDKKLYPEYDDLLLRSMLAEPVVSFTISLKTISVS